MFVVRGCGRYVCQGERAALPGRTAQRDLRAPLPPFRMIELRTLGTLELRTTDGQELRPILQQPKRLALFAYLALAMPRRFHRRDALLVLFWPELDTEHARGSLRRSLHFLRRTLGDNVIVGRGDEEIGIAPDAVWSDVLAFEEASEAGDLATALSLYRGDLLDGFYIAGAPDFERWLDRERARLLARAARGGWTFAERLAAERHADAAARARWAASLTPHDDTAHRRLVSLLADTGDRVGATRAFDDFAKRLRADYEIEPSSELCAVVATIRAEEARARETSRSAATAVRNAGVITEALEQDTPHPISSTIIAVLPFTVRGSRDLAYLGEGMVDLLSTTLDLAGDLRTVDPRALLAHLARSGHDGAQPLDPETGRAAARALGAGRYLLGSIVQAGGRIRISATLYDDAAMATSSAEATGSSEAGLFDMVDALARQLLGGEQSGPRLRLAKLATRTTESLPALKAYLRGECDFRAGRYFQALESYQNAAAEDARFALAWFRLAAAAAATADHELACEASAQAWGNRERLGPHDRLLLDAQRAWLRGAADEAERLYVAALATHADDIEAWFALGDLLFHHNPQRGRSIVESRDAFERAVHYDPDHLASLVHLVRLAAFEVRDGDVRALVARVLELSPAGDRALSMRALRAFALRNEVEKAHAVTSLVRARPLAVGIAFTDILLYAHDIVGGHRLARILARLARGTEMRALSHVTLALLNQARGRFVRASSEIARIVPHDVAWGLEMRALLALHPFSRQGMAELDATRTLLAEWDPESGAPNRLLVLSSHNDMHAMLREYLLGALSARLGDEREAGERADALDAATDSPVAAGFAAHLARSVRAQAARAAGDAAGALRLLGTGPPVVWYQLAVASPVFAGVLERYLRAELLEELGRPDEAIGWYASLGESSPYELPYLAPAQLRLSFIHAGLGHAAQAAEHASRVVRLWDGADAHVRQLADEAVRRAAAGR